MIALFVRADLHGLLQRRCASALSERLAFGIVLDGSMLVAAKPSRSAISCSNGRAGRVADERLPCPGRPAIHPFGFVESLVVLLKIGLRWHRTSVAAPVVWPCRRSAIEVSAPAMAKVEEAASSFRNTRSHQRALASRKSLEIVP